jgi:hypothetical protein
MNSIEAQPASAGVLTQGHRNKLEEAARRTLGRLTFNRRLRAACHVSVIVNPRSLLDANRVRSDRPSTFPVFERLFVQLSFHFPRFCDSEVGVTDPILKSKTSTLNPLESK